MSKNLTESVFRRKLAAYLAGGMSLRAFNDWFVPSSWKILPTASDELREFIYEIKLRLAEYSSGHWTKSQLREKLFPLALSRLLVVDSGVDRIRTQSLPPKTISPAPSSWARRVQQVVPSEGSASHAQSVTASW